jgi:hypothetical protein
VEWPCGKLGNLAVFVFGNLSLWIPLWTRLGTTADQLCRWGLAGQLTKVPTPTLRKMREERGTRKR